MGRGTRPRRRSASIAATVSATTSTRRRSRSARYKTWQPRRSMSYHAPRTMHRRAAAVGASMKRGSNGQGSREEGDHQQAQADGQREEGQEEGKGRQEVAPQPHGSDRLS